MNIQDDLLRYEEKALFALRSLYSRCGYRQYKMSKFEEYDLYVRNKNFLISDSVITFTDTSGKLMALKPDVTLSIVKNLRELESGIEKLYYNENVYRIADGSFKEILQLGLECLGDIDAPCCAEVLLLAAKSLEALSADYVLDVSHLGLLSLAIEESGLPENLRQELLRCIREKNRHGALALYSEAGLSEDRSRPVLGLLDAPAAAAQALPYLRALLPGEQASVLLDELEAALTPLNDEKIRLDFSVIQDMNYYNGLVFQGFIEGISNRVLSGGQYDPLVQKLGRDFRAIGFAVYLDALFPLENAAEKAEGSPGPLDADRERRFVNIALPKGRLGEKVYRLFENAGYECPELLGDSRKLVFENAEKGVRYFWVKPSDVAIYVERGAADIGVAGKDCLLEEEPDLYELMDLDTGKCRLAVAAPEDFVEDPNRPLRVATKFTHLAKEYYRTQGRDIDIIHLNGSIEIAPLLGLSDVIVDLVETGKTLKENHLEVRKTIMNISARLVANKTACKFKDREIDTMIKALAEAMSRGEKQ